VYFIFWRKALEKVKKREDEAMFGSKPAVAAGAKRGLPPTPTKLPAKMRKVYRFTCYVYSYFLRVEVLFDIHCLSACSLFFWYYWLFVVATMGCKILSLIWDYFFSDIRNTILCRSESYLYLYMISVYV